MSRTALLAICLLAGCASAEDANSGGERDLSVAESGDDLAGGGGGDLAHGPGTIGCAGQHVVINEVQTGSPASANDEFIELYNPCATAIDLTGSSIVYRSAAGTSDVVIVNLNKMIAPGGFYLVTGPIAADGGMADQSYGAGRMSGTGGGVALRDPTQTLVDSVGYGTATNAFIEASVAAAPASGQSIARKPNGYDTDHNSSDFAVAATPTPRAAN
jgi:predicted extracellular nuclease